MSSINVLKRIWGVVKVIMLLGMVGVPSLSWAGPYSPAPFYHNLIVNPNGDTGDLSGWTITGNGGNGWFVNRGADVTRDHDNGFSTSYSWATREQTIDLIAQGFSAEFLDAQPPLIVSEIFERVYCADNFFLTVELLDANRNVLRTWSSGERRHQDTTCDYSGYREQISMELSHYGAGVRFIRWRDGGKDSENWWGHYGPKLQNAYLGFAPANLLKNPGELSSWTILENGGNGFSVSGPPEARRFSTSWGWAKRQQTVNLLALGYTASELDTGQLPIFASASYGKVACSDNYYLKVQLLDQNYNVLANFDSGVRTHEGACDWSYSPYREVLTHRFNNYPAGVRYIRWEEGGKDSEIWNGHYGAYMENPYLAIVNHTAAHRSSRRLLSELSVSDYWPSFFVGTISYGLAGLACVGSLGVGCAPALAAATVVTATTVQVNTGIVLTVTPSHHTDNPATACDAGCKLYKTKQNLDVDALGQIWSLDSNDSVQILAGPKAGASIATPAQEMVSAVKLAVESGERFIDITTLADITGSDWHNALAAALKTVEARAAANNTAPVVRIYIGLSGYYTGTVDWLRDALIRELTKYGFPNVWPDLGIAEFNWNSHLRGVLDKVTGQLVGNSRMQIYISGGRSPRDNNWNHSKIVAVDGKRAIVGGHNLWGEYFGTQPVFDTSVNVVGDSSKAAHRFADQLWRIQQRDFLLSNTNGGNHILRWERKAVSTNVTGTPASTSILSAPSGATGNIQILSVGQLGKSEYASQVKKAVMNMIDTAEESIYISQQSIVHPFVSKPLFAYLYQTIDQPLVTRLAQKAIAGVDVKLVLSNEDAPHDTGANMSTRKMLELIWRAAVQNGVGNTINNRKNFCQYFDIGNLRVGSSDVYPGGTQSFANHSKTVMIDKQVFLVGSHNLYEQAPAQLSEFSYVVADASKAQEYYRQYWQPVLSDLTRTLFDDVECLSIITGANVNNNL